MPARSLHGFLNPSAEPKGKSFWILAPFIGAIIFVILYIAAAMLYPGGSQADTHSKGFSWIHNYWCNLLNEKGLNGEANAARNIAVAAMVVLIASLAGFWAICARLLFSKRGTRVLLISAGLLCVATLAFLSTAFHDAVINISGAFGLIAMVICYVGIYKKGWNLLLAFGIFNILLLALNNYLYYGGHFGPLPLVQKITFFSFLVWICLVDIRLYQGRHNS
jgi:hypothetical protein